MWHKYLAAALTWTNSPSIMGRFLPFWLSPSLSVDFIVFLAWHYLVWHLPAPLPSFFTIIQLSVGRRKNESWELSAYTPRGGVFLLPCISQAGCFCVRGGCRLNPTGGSPEVKEIGDRGWASRLVTTLFGFPPLSVRGSSSVLSCSINLFGPNFEQHMLLACCVPVAVITASAIFCHRNQTHTSVPD